MSEAYPQTIYANVLLLDNKIIDWKIGSTKRDNPMFWTIRTGIANNQLDKLTAETNTFIAENEEEKRIIFDSLGSAWFENWEHAEDYSGRYAYEVNQPKETLSWQDKYSYQGWYVWKLNEFDWVCGKSLIEVLNWYKNERDRELNDDELTDSELKLCELSKKVLEDDGISESSFLDIIKQVGNDFKEPWIIASAEY